MYSLNPPHVFVHNRVYENKKALARLEKMLNGLGNPSFEEVNEDGTDKVIEAAGTREELPVQSDRVRQGIEKIVHDPGYVLRAGFTPIVPHKNWRDNDSAGKTLCRRYAGYRPSVGRFHDAVS